MRAAPFLAVAFLAFPILADDVAVGDAREVVVKKLGRPIGRLMLGSKEILSYHRGFVYLQEGQASWVKMISVEEAARISRERAAVEKVAEAERLQRIQQAEDEKSRLMADESYKTNSAAAQVAMWDAFKEKHPDASPPDSYTEAVRQKQKDEEAAAAQIARAAPKVYPKLSGSKRKKYRRAGDTNMVDIAESAEIAEEQAVTERR